MSRANNSRVNSTRVNNAQVAAARALELKKRQKRRRRLLGALFTMALTLMIAGGVALGSAVGVAAEYVRETNLISRFIRVEEPSLPANKINPPKPVDVSGPAVACAASSLTLSVRTERTALQYGEATGIHIVATNSGRYPCLVNGGMENLRFRMVDTSGNNAFSWADCNPQGKRKLLVGPGMQVTWDLAWDGHTSSPGVCTGGQPPLPAGSWQLIASLAEVAHSDSDPGIVIVQGPVVPEPEPEPATTVDETLAPVTPELSVPSVLEPADPPTTDPGGLSDTTSAGTELPVSDGDDG